MFLIYSLILSLHFSTTNCDLTCDCSEINLLKETVMDIVHQEILERKMESSRLRAKIRRLEASQRSTQTPAGVSEQGISDRLEKIETKIGDIDVKLNEKSEVNQNIVDIVKKGLRSEKENRIDFISDVESKMAEINGKVANFKTETITYIERCSANMNATQDKFRQDMNAKLLEMEGKTDLNVRSVTWDLHDVEQDLLETNTTVSKLNDMVLIGRIDGGWTAWGVWSTCSSSCGGGIRERLRTCSNPSPSVLGRGCQGSSVMTGSCGNNLCAVHKEAFTATGIDAGDGSVARFHNVKYNYGGGYSDTTGKFTCKIPGMYHFVATLSIKQKEENDIINCLLYVKGASTLQLYAKKVLDSDFTFPATAAGTFHLNKGDTVYVGSCSEYERIYDDYSTIFTGFLVSADN